MTNQNETMLNLAALHENLKTMMKPEVLTKFTELLESIGSPDGSMLERFKFFLEKNGSDCRYAAMAKEFFLKDHASGCAKAICWLYHNWAKNYEGK